ncbi:EamA family transporter, partial [Streptomyces sp. NPDC001940]
WFRGIGRLTATQVTFLGPLSPLTAAVIGWAAGDRPGSWAPLRRSGPAPRTGPGDAEGRGDGAGGPRRSATGRCGAAARGAWARSARV